MCECGRADPDRFARSPRLVRARTICALARAGSNHMRARPSRHTPSRAHARPARRVRARPPPSYPSWMVASSAGKPKTSCQYKRLERQTVSTHLPALCTWLQATTCTYLVRLIAVRTTTTPPFQEGMAWAPYDLPSWRAFLDSLQDREGANFCGGAQIARGGRASCQRTAATTALMNPAVMGAFAVSPHIQALPKR